MNELLKFSRKYKLSDPKVIEELIYYVDELNYNDDIKSYISTVETAYEDKWKEDQIAEWNSDHIGTVEITYIVNDRYKVITVDLNDLNADTYWNLLDYTSHKLSEKTGYPTLYFILLPFLTWSHKEHHKYVDLDDIVEPTTEYNTLQLTDRDNITKDEIIEWMEILMKYLRKGELYKLIDLSKVIFEKLEINDLLGQLLRVAKAVNLLFESDDIKNDKSKVIKKSRK